MNEPDLTSADTHFAFGKNWSSYAERITQGEIDEAVRGLSRLLAKESLAGKRVLDIGSGSGLHSLAALRLGAKEVVAVDIDRDSVATTSAVLEKFAYGQAWRAEVRSVFDVIPNDMGLFDVVYTWGVLHHTGSMIRAIRSAASMCAPRGLFIFALYRRVWFDWFWRIEKKWYAGAGLKSQERARRVHILLLKVGLSITGRHPRNYINKYRGNRGMDFHHDIHDWMGGWPYESILPHEVKGLMNEMKFDRVSEFTRSGFLFGRELGFFGSGCDEYVYRARAATTAIAD